jgi:hypothetical protein
MNRVEWTKIDRIAKKIKAIRYLGNKCIYCGEDNIFKLSFHHVNSNEKDNNVNRIRQLRWSVIENEIKKCFVICHNCHMKFHYNESQGKKSNNKKIYLEYKGINGCEKCGYNECNASLDFYHPNNDKDFILSDITISYNSIEDFSTKIEDELNKCVILCKNCHALEHSDVEFYEKNKEIILKKSYNIKEINSKIDREKVREMYSSGIKQIEISKFFNVKKSTISMIIKKFKNQEIL